MQIAQTAQIKQPINVQTHFLTANILSHHERLFIKRTFPGPALRQQPRQKPPASFVGMYWNVLAWASDPAMVAAGVGTTGASSSSSSHASHPYKSLIKYTHTTHPYNTLIQLTHTTHTVPARGISPPDGAVPRPHRALHRHARLRLLRQGAPCGPPGNAVSRPVRPSHPGTPTPSATARLCCCPPRPVTPRCALHA